MRLLVVGATGSLGRLAVAEAAQRGHNVTALVRDPARVGHVSRHDLARVLIDAAERPDYLHQAIVVGS